MPCNSVFVNTPVCVCFEGQRLVDYANPHLSVSQMKSHCRESGNEKFGLA